MMFRNRDRVTARSSLCAFRVSRVCLVRGVKRERRRMCRRYYIVPT